MPSLTTSTLTTDAIVNSKRSHAALDHLIFNRSKNRLEADRPIRTILNSFLLGDQHRISSGGDGLFFEDLSRGINFQHASAGLKDQSIVANQDISGLIQPFVRVHGDNYSLDERNGPADSSGAVSAIDQVTAAANTCFFDVEFITEEIILITDHLHINVHSGTSESGVLTFHQRFAGTAYSVGDTVKLFFTLPFEVRTGAVFHAVIKKSRTEDSRQSLITVRRSQTQPTKLYIKTGTRTFTDDNLVVADEVTGAVTIAGDLTVDGTTTTVNSQTLVVEDKNIELGVVTTPTDVTADGGGIVLKGTTDKTILWNNTTNSWDFNQAIRIGNLELTGNTLSSITGDIDVTTQTGGVFKFNNDALRAGLDASNYLEIGHGGSNSFVNSVGAGNMDFRFAGVNKATFTSFGHLHLKTDVDQKHNLKIITANNLNDTGIAWENSGGAFTHTIFRTDVGSNRADLIFAIGQNSDIDLLTNSFKIHGSAANEGRLEILGELQISSGSPGVNKVLTSDALGIATWEVAIGGGWVDDGTVVRLATGSDSVGIGTSTPQTTLQVSGPGGAVVGGFPSGALHITSSLAGVNSNAVITGHNIFGGNKQLWYFGSTGSSDDNIAFINRQTGTLSLITSGNSDILLTPNGTGKVVIGTQLTIDNIDIDGNTIFVTDLNGDLILDASAAGSGVVKVTDQLEIVGSTSQLLLTDSDNDKTFIVKSNLGDFSITEVGGNNAFKILGGAAVNSLKITANQVEIGTRLDVGNLRLDVNTISSRDTDGNIILSPNGTGDVSISSNTIIGSTSVNPDGTLHVHRGSSGAVSASSVANALVVEDSTNNGISILTPATSSGRIIFGSPADPFGAFIAWSDSVNDFAIGSSKIGANLRLTSDQETTNLTLSGGLGNELATFVKDVTITGQVKIAGGTPGTSKVLRSDADGLAVWGDIGWTDLGTVVTLLNGNDDVGIGTATPDTKLHAAEGSAGVVTAFAGTVVTLESTGNTFLSLLSPDANVRGILFGEPSSNTAGGIFYNDSGSIDGFQFRVNGGVTKLTIESDGTVGVNTANPDLSAVLDVTSTTKGFLPPRMTTTQRDAIVSPLPGLKIHNTTIDKAEVFTGTTWKTILTEDVATVVVQETFASTNVRYFGELGLPSLQAGWTETGTGVISLEVGDNVFGVIKDTVKHFSTTGNGTKSESPITGADWDNILTFGASFSAITRMTDSAGNSMFAGVGFSGANDPRASSTESRAGVFISVDATHTTILLDGTTIITLDGTGGNPLVLKDDWFTWEAVINPTLDAGISFGVVDLYVNNVLIVTGAVVSSNNAVSDEVSLANSSSSGTTTFYADNFGITIYEELATKTLAAVTMAGNVAQINIPEGRRDYTIILLDGNPRAIGAVLRMVVNNLSGKVTLTNQNLSVPEILYNGLRTFVFNVKAKEIVEGVNTVDQANVYLGFELATRHVGGKFIDTTDQIIAIADTPQVITFNTNKIIDDITHAIGSSVFNINTSGTYKLEVAPQVFQGSGAAKVEFWLRKNGTDIVNTGVQFDIGANSQALPLLLWKEEVIAGDTIECVWASDSANTKLDNLTSLFGGPNIPSIMFRMTLVAI